MKAQPGECGNVGSIYQKPNEDLMLVVVATKGIWGSRNGGDSWQKLGMGAGSDSVTNRGTRIVFDPVRPNTFWESGIYGPGVFRTDDNGNAFKRLGTIEHNDWLSVDFTDPNRQTLLAGGHEQGRGRNPATLQLSKDGGNTWVNIGANPQLGTAFESHPHVVNSTTFFLGLYQSWNGGSAGIYQTNDSGATWSLKTAETFSSGPAFAARDGSIYWAGQDGSVIRATGSGSNWSFKQTAPGGTLKTIDPVSIVELPDGRLAGLANSYIMTSSDQGVTWKISSPQLPFGFPGGFAYASADNSFYVWPSFCNNTTSAGPIFKYWLQ